MAVCIKDCIQNMNLVIGCTIGCSYCYARNNVRRFHMIDDFDKPEFFPNKLRLMEKKRPQNFLLTGMSDFAHWNPEWRNQIFSKMAENPQHQYLFLTKRPEDIVFSTTLENAWFGVTVTSSKEKNRIRTLREHIHGGHYHLTGTTSSMSNIEAADVICDSLNEALPPPVGRYQALIEEVTTSLIASDISKDESALTVLGLQNKTSLGEGLKKTVSWYLNNPRWYNQSRTRFFYLWQNPETVLKIA